MEIREFLDLPEEERDYLVWLHNKRNRIRKEYQELLLEYKKLNNRKVNIQLECDHPYAVKKYEADENEFGNYTGGGSYLCTCEDCGNVWREDK